MVRPDHHNEIEFNLLKSGSVTYLLGGRKVRVPSHRVSIFWAAIPHQVIEYDTTEPYYAATIPLTIVLQGKFPEQFIQPLLEGAIFTDTPENSEGNYQDLDLFAQWEKDLRNPDPETEDIVITEMGARLKRLARNLSHHGHLESRDPHPSQTLLEGGLSKVEQMACLIAREFTKPLLVQDISAAVGLHPNYAMQIFKKVIGTTIVDYLTNHRISHAQRLLATTSDKIIEIAFQSGFNSLSRFNEAFRRSCGCPPREYRKRHRI